MNQASSVKQSGATTSAQAHTSLHYRTGSRPCQTTGEAAVLHNPSQATPSGRKPWACSPVPAQSHCHRPGRLLFPNVAAMGDACAAESAHPHGVDCGLLRKGVPLRRRCGVHYSLPWNWGERRHVVSRVGRSPSMGLAVNSARGAVGDLGRAGWLRIEEGRDPRAEAVDAGGREAANGLVGAKISFAPKQSANARAGLDSR